MTRPQTDFERLLNLRTVAAMTPMDFPLANEIFISLEITFDF